MVFKSDRQRKAFFATGNFKRSPRTPLIMGRRAGPSRLKPSEKKFLADKIRKNIREGKPRKQAIAIAFSQARKKFGKERIPEIKNQKTDKIDSRTRRLLFLIFGTAIALSLLRQIRK